VAVYRKLIGLKVKRYSFLCTHLRATRRYLPYGITQCYLSPDTGERLTPARKVLNVLTQEGWKAELT